MLQQAAGFIAHGLRRMDDDGGEHAHVRCVEASFHASGHQDNPQTYVCDGCGDEHPTPCRICSNAFSFAVRELVESGAVALRDIDGEMSLVVTNRTKLDEVPEPVWKRAEA
jgi:hypothetical protein